MITDHGVMDGLQHQEREREEFLALVDALEGPANAVRADARWQVEKCMPAEAVVPHLVALWPIEERKRQRRVRVHPCVDAVILGAFGLALVALTVLETRSTLTTFWGHLFIILVLTLGLIGPSHASRTLSRQQRGLLRVLVAARHPSLVPLYLDALALAPSASDRRTLARHLTELLPAYADGDTPSLDRHQQGVLLREIRRRVRRTKRTGRLRDRDGRFLAAALYALESEAVRSVWPTGETRLITEAAEAARSAGSEGVERAAEDCLLRLRL